VTHKENGYGTKPTCNLFPCLRKEHPVTVITALTFNFANYNAKNKKKNSPSETANCKYKSVFCLKYAKEQSHTNLLQTTATRRIPQSQIGFSCACAVRYENRGNSTAGSSHPSLPYMLVHIIILELVTAAHLDIRLEITKLIVILFCTSSCFPTF
jgi:hypothetical protein